MGVKEEGKLSDSLLVRWGILVHNTLKNKALCVISHSVKFSDSPQYILLSLAHHPRAGTRARRSCMDSTCLLLLTSRRGWCDFSWYACS